LTSNRPCGGFLLAVWRLGGTATLYLGRIFIDEFTCLLFMYGNEFLFISGDALDSRPAKPPISVRPNIFY
jgi:hypothetical protein